MRLQPADWMFLSCSPSAAAATRYWGQVGEDERRTLLGRCARVYNRANAPLLDEGFPEVPRCAAEVGVAVVDDDGAVVVAYYGPGDERNTPVDFAAYQRQRQLQLGERRPVSSRVTAELRTDVPQAARAPQESGPCH